MDPIKIRVTADTEEAVSEIRNVIRAANDLERATTTSVEKAAKKLDELNKKYEQVKETVEANKKRVEELSAAKEKASNEEKNRIEQELENLKRITAGREIELLKINEKRIKLEEVGRIAVAADQEEVEWIKYLTEQRLIENNALRDTARAQLGVKEAAEESTSSVGKFIQGFAGLVSVGTALAAISDQFRKSREQADLMLEAAEKLRNLGASVFAGDQGALNALGLQGDDAVAGQKVITGLQDKFRLKRGTITSALESLAPILKDRGIAYDSQEGQEFTGQAALLKERGLGSEQVANLLAANPNASSQEFAQVGADVISAMGSPQEATKFLADYQENKTKFDAAGLTFTDALKIGVAANQSGDRIARGTALKQVGAGLDRLIGKSPHQYLESFQTMGDYKHGEDQGLGGMTDLEKFNQLKRYSAIPEVVPFFDAAVKGRKLDVVGLLKTVRTLSKDKQERFWTETGGNRNMAAELATSGADNVQLPTGTLSQSPTAPGYQSDVDTQRAQAESLTLDSAEGAYGNEAIKAEMNRLSHHPEEMTWLASTDRGLPFSELLLKPQVRQQAAANVGFRRMIALAKLREDANSGKVKMTPFESAKLDNVLEGLNESVQGDNYDKASSDPELNVLATGGDAAFTRYGGTRYNKTRAQLLKEIERNQQQYIERKGMGHMDDFSGQFKNDRAYIDRLNGADSLLHPKPPTTRPTTRPSSPPVSMHYHSINYNYAYPYSALGDAVESENRMG